MAASLAWRPVNARRNIIGEGPFWDEESGRLYLVDIAGRAVLSTDGEGRDAVIWPMPGPVSAAIPRQRGGLVVALAGGAYLFQPGGNRLERLVDTEPDIADNRSNETRTDPWGRLWLGTMQNNIAADGAPLPVTRSSGTLAMIGADGRSHRRLADIGIANTLCWSPAGDRLYFADTLAGVIYVFAFDTGSGALSDRRVFSDLAGHGAPDGSAIDEHGYLWNARWGGGCVIRFAPDGMVDRIIPVPVTQPTSCVFGGPDRTRLYLTSARHGLVDEALADNPLEGATLTAETGIRGERCVRFAG